MQIKQFAHKYKLTADTIRFYEKEGLLKPLRQNNGYRVYDLDCEEKIKFILVLRQLGFTLNEIKQLLALEQMPISPSCNEETVQLFSSKITYIEQQLNFYQQAIQSLQLAQNLMNKGMYEENKDTIAVHINNMYESLQKGSNHHVSS